MRLPVNLRECRASNPRERTTSVALRLDSGIDPHGSGNPHGNRESCKSPGNGTPAHPNQREFQKQCGNQDAEREQRNPWPSSLDVSRGYAGQNSTAEKY